MLKNNIKFSFLLLLFLFTNAFPAEVSLQQPRELLKNSKNINMRMLDFYKRKYALDKVKAIKQKELKIIKEQKTDKSTILTSDTSFSAIPINKKEEQRQILIKLAEHGDLQDLVRFLNKPILLSIDTEVIMILIEFNKLNKDQFAFNLVYYTIDNYLIAKLSKEFFKYRFNKDGVVEIRWTIGETLYNSGNEQRIYFIKSFIADLINIINFAKKHDLELFQHLIYRYNIYGLIEHIIFLRKIHKKYFDYLDKIYNDLIEIKEIYAKSLEA